MSAEKRPAQDDPTSSQLVVKRPNLGTSTGMLTRTGGGGAGGAGGAGALTRTVPRMSGLPAPVMELTGHSGEILAARFDPTGMFIASGSTDKNIFLWNGGGECENYGMLTGHRGAIFDLRWSRDSTILFSASADTHLASWDLESGTRIRRYVGHEEIVNAIDLARRGEGLLVSGSDDSSLGIWDPRSRNPVDHIQTGFPITAVAVSETGHDVYTAGIDNDIRLWDLRKNAVVYSLLGHADTVTSLALSPDSTLLLSFSMDSTARTWDVRPFAPTERHVRTFDGAAMGAERNLVRASWDPAGRRIAAGAGDGTVVVWSSETGKLTYKLPGHRGVVNCAEFSPGKEPLILSASSDRRMLLGELR